ncbi:MAG: universal stress protein [Myxococcota bacterium]
MTVMVQQVAALLALDGRDEAVLGAVRAVARRARVGRVFLVHVVEAGEPDRGPGRLDAAARSLAADLDGVEVIAEAAAGRTEEEVGRLVVREDLDLLVVGRRNETGWGPHGLRVLRAADCPILVVPEGSRLGDREAVVGMDLSDGARAAMRVAAQLCARVRPVAVVDPSAEGADENELRAQVRQAWAHATEGQEAPAIEVVVGAPADALLAAAKGADLVAIGSRGLTPVAATLLGSTAERLGARAEAPVLVYRQKGEHRGLLRALFRW